MSLVLPDLIIVNSVNLALQAVRTDYRNAVINGQEERSMLYLLFNGLSLGRYDLFENVIALLITTPENPKHIEAVSGYQMNDAKAPQVFVTLPSENAKNNSTSIGEGDQEPLFFDNSPDSQDEYRKQYSRRYNTTYHIVIMCENRSEMIVLYNLINALLTVSINHFAMEGLENLQLGGQDLNLHNSLPDRIYRRAITMTFEYEKVIPEFVIQSVFREIRLFWKPDGAEVAQGPIIFSTEDDIPDSDSTP